MEEWERGVRLVKAQGGGAGNIRGEQGGGGQGLDEVGGLEDVKAVLRRAVEWPLLHQVPRPTHSCCDPHLRCSMVPSSSLFLILKFDSPFQVPPPGPR